MTPRPNIYYCDDANLISGDGCDSNCEIESGWKCSGGTTSSKDVCIEICGDGIRIKQACDDGNTVSKDG